MHADDMKSGYGRMIYSDKNIYDGKYDKGCKNGLGYFIDAETGLASRKLYKK